MGRKRWRHREEEGGEERREEAADRSEKKADAVSLQTEPGSEASHNINTETVFHYQRPLDVLFSSYSILSTTNTNILSQNDFPYHE